LCQALRIQQRLARSSWSEAEHRTAGGYPVDFHGDVLLPRPSVFGEPQAVGHYSLIASGVD
jgi:hypothetical protein